MDVQKKPENVLFSASCCPLSLGAHRLQEKYCLCRANDHPCAKKLNIAVENWLRATDAPRFVPEPLLYSVVQWQAALVCLPDPLSDILEVDLLRLAKK